MTDREMYEFRPPRYSGKDHSESWGRMSDRHFHQESKRIADHMIGRGEQLARRRFRLLSGLAPVAGTGQNNGTCPPQAYGHDPALIEPEDGGYSFIEWEDLDLSIRKKMFRKALGWKEESWQWLLDEQLDTMEHTIRGLRGTWDIRYGIDRLGFGEPGYAAQVERQMSQYLKASPPEIEAIERLISQHGDKAGSVVTIPYPLHKYTCGFHTGDGFTPVKPGNMVNAITMSDPVVAQVIPASQHHREQYVYRVKIVRLS